MIRASNPKLSISVLFFLLLAVFILSFLPGTTRADERKKHTTPKTDAGNETEATRPSCPDKPDVTRVNQPSLANDRTIYKNSWDPITKRIVVDKELCSRFFSSSAYSYKWYIIQHKDGTLENTLGGPVTPADRKTLEHTSNCISTHQGEHLMHFCEASLHQGLLRLKIHGGLPAYASSLLVEINENKNFTCFFQAAYPASVSNLHWKILCKELKVKSDDFKKGNRLYAWIQVEFEEKSAFKGREINKTHRIEGFLKPIVH